MKRSVTTICAVRCSYACVWWIVFRMYDVRYDDQTKSEQYTLQRQARMTMAVWWLSSPEISAGTLPGSKNVRILPINLPMLQAADIYVVKPWKLKRLHCWAHHVGRDIRAGNSKCITCHGHYVTHGTHSGARGTFSQYGLATMSEAIA